VIRDTFDRFRHPERGRFGDNESVRGNDSVRSDVIDITIAVHHRTDRAVLVSIDGDEARAQWLPLSLIEFEVTGKFTQGRRKSGQAVELATAIVTLPQRLAKEKGLV
jgi:hypothetical protein